MRSVFLMYHDIYKNAPATGIPASAAYYHITTDAFQEHLDRIAQANILVLSISQYLAGESRDSLVITFDDGWAGVYEHALPLLMEKGWPVTVFITKDFINRASFLDEQQIIVLASYPQVEVGLHGTTHRLFSACTPNEIMWELRTCKEYLENLINRPVTFASLPGGDNHLSLEACARQVGLIAVCTSQPGVNTAATNRFDLRRVAIYRKTTPKEITHFCHFDLRREVFRSRAIEIPRRLLGSRHYTYMRRVLFNDSSTPIELYKP